MVKSPRLRSAKGFTLIELLIIIGIIGFLASAILVAVDPVKRIQDARNAKRWSEVNGILNAILTKQVDDRAAYNGVTGALLLSTGSTQVIVSSHTSPTAVVCSVPATAPACPYATGAGSRPAALVTTANQACVANLSDLAPTYIAELPLDPIGGTPTAANLPIGANNSGYYISRAASGRIEIGSCYPDQTADIKVKR
jgi:type II secretory pathway pseudopilin PulG